jgi:hypothetical protein
MAQKLLLFWRKPARRCWWEGVELDNVRGVEGKLKVWIRRVWTLEMVSHHRETQNSTNITAERHWIALTHALSSLFCYLFACLSHAPLHVHPYQFVYMVRLFKFLSKSTVLQLAGAG